MALARALITNPSVLLLDEPLSALDPFLRGRMREELKRLQRELGITFVHVTHAQDEAMALADLIVVMERGRILQSDAPRAVFERPRTPFVARFLGGHNIIECRPLGDGAFALPDGSAIRVDEAAPAGSATVRLAVRSDRMRLMPGDDLPNRMAGEVTAVEYHGSFVRVGHAGRRRRRSQPAAVGGRFLRAPGGARRPRGRRVRAGGRASARQLIQTGDMN